jgi:hypothetical protein
MTLQSIAMTNVLLACLVMISLVALAILNRILNK